MCEGYTVVQAQKRQQITGCLRVHEHTEKNGMQEPSSRARGRHAVLSTCAAQTCTAGQGLGRKSHVYKRWPKDVLAPSAFCEIVVTPRLEQLRAIAAKPGKYAVELLQQLIYQ